MRFHKILFSICFPLLFALTTEAQKNITKPNVISHNGVSVNTYTGAMIYQRQDIYIPGKGLDLDLMFSYSNVSLDNDWGFGPGWTMSYNMSYYMDTMDLVIVHMDGSRNRYIPNGSGGYSCPSGNYDSLELYAPNQFRLTNKEGMKYFFDNSSHQKLTKIEDRYGNSIALSYTDTLLTQITDASGRNVNLAWTDGYLTTITDPNTVPARTVTFEYDSEGNPIKVTNPLGDFMAYAYDDNHYILSVINENGYPLYIEYNSLAAVRRLISCVGIQQITYNYDLLRTYLVEKVGGQDQITTYQFDELGRLTEQVGNCCGVNVKFEYDPDNNIVKRIDANGYTTSFTHDNKGNVLTETNPLGNAVVYTYEPTYNLLASETDRNGNTTSYTYDSEGNLIQIDKPLGISESFTYDAFGNMLSFTDGNNNIITYTYDTHGNKLTQLKPNAFLTTWTYDDVGNVRSVTDPNNHTTQFEYNLRNWQVQQINALLDTLSYTYDAVGNRVIQKDENGNTQTFTYDGVDRRTTATDALGNSQVWQYDAHGNILKEIDAHGNTKLFQYDELNRLIASIEPTGEQTFYLYDGPGNLITIQSHGGNISVRTYDALNRVIEENDNLGLVFTRTYDNNSNLKTRTDGNDNTYSYFYDALNRLTKMVDPLGLEVNYTFDANGNTTSAIDRNGNTTSFTYDVLNRPIKVTEPHGTVSDHVFDGIGNLTSITDGNNATTLMAYDALDRKVSETYPDASPQSFTYTPTGQIATRTNNNGHLTTYTYDNAYRLLNKTFDDGSKDEFTYDAVGNILTAHNTNASIQLVYDQSNRVISENLNGKATLFSYDSAQRIRGIQYPSGRQIFEYQDQRERLQSIIDNTILVGVLATFDHDLGNRTVERNFANNTLAEYSYDNNSRLNSVKHTMNFSAEFEYSMDNAGNRLVEKRVHQTSKSRQYTYDDLHRLLERKVGVLSGNSIPSPADEKDYSYDFTGNRTAVVNNGVPTNYNSNNLNQYTSLSGGMSFVLSYDLNGNTLADDLHFYSYDFENRLVEVDNGSTAKYQYDAFGRRFNKIVGSDTTFFYYDNTRVIEERGNNGTVEATYMYGESIDEILSMHRGGQSYYFHQDATGSVSFTTNESGDVVESYEYDSFGNPEIYDANNTLLAGSAIGNPNLFVGRYWDEEAGLYYFRARHYSPKLGRFFQRDPIIFADGLNFYGYVRNNPVLFSDPLGMKCDLGEAASQVCAIGPVDAWTARGNAKEAEKATSNSGLPGAHNGPADAFRHCFWNCRMAQDIGKNQAKKVGDIHEDCGSGPPGENNMDLNNNRVGRSLGNKGVDCAAACRRALNNGSLVKSPSNNKKPKQQYNYYKGEYHDYVYDNKNYNYQYEQRYNYYYRY